MKSRRDLIQFAALAAVAMFNIWLFDPWKRMPSGASWQREYDYSNPLALNPNSSMYSDIVGIYHDPRSSSIRVIVRGHDTDYDDGTNSSRKPCLRPYLVGRLSGPAIGMISQWIYLPKGDESTVIEGHYEVPMAGTYFLEIIVIFCNTYDEEKMRQARNVTTPGDWKEDAAFVREMEHIMEHCLEHPLRHRLTAQNLSIEVTQAAPNMVVADKSDRPMPQEKEESALGGLHGYWQWNSASNQSIVPLYTRYGISCNDSANCVEAGSLERFSTYRFVWTSNVNLTDQLHSSEPIEQARIVPRHVVDEDTLVKLIRVRSQSRVNETICLIGASHSRGLMEYLTPLMDIPVLHFRVTYAYDLGGSIADHPGSDPAASVNNYISNTICSVFVIGLGAWVRGLKFH
jgi:hypothetical protein